MRKVFTVLIITAATMVAAAQSIEISEPVRFLALGDSYTIGQSVEENQRWPVQLIDVLKEEYGIQDAEVDIIARTGWTTGNLKAGIAQQLDTEKEYNLASLLIGVNNQYQGLDFNIYAPEFRELLDIAISAVGGDTGKVFIVSIPDYAFTPSFRNDARVSSEIDAYNAVNESIAREYGVLYFNTTPISRNGLENPDLVADDQLHPSGLQYKQWVGMMLPFFTCAP
ncbi:MAG: SGNH/GDSL hydrolase family protein [Bacteroidales bacterium]|nr:SGNH/GDSL hydrolase family protein [Bacteroidales bacterium]